MMDPAVADLIRGVAACRTFAELCEYEDDALEPSGLDELILRARDLVDTLGLHLERAP